MGGKSLGLRRREILPRRWRGWSGFPEQSEHPVSPLVKPDTGRTAANIKRDRSDTPVSELAGAHSEFPLWVERGNRHRTRKQTHLCQGLVHDCLKFIYGERNALAMCHAVAVSAKQR